MKRRKVKRHFWQYLPAHFFRGFLLFMVAAYLLLQGLYWYEFTHRQYMFNETLSQDGILDISNMLGQASLKEQEADFRYYLEYMANSASYTITSNWQTGDAYAAVLDPETGRVILDTGEVMSYLMIKGYEERFLNHASVSDKVSIFQCPSQVLQGVKEQLEGWKKEVEDAFSGYRAIRIQDAYLKGDGFLPGKVTVEMDGKFWDGSGGYLPVQKKQEFDLTPDDVSGYIHVKAEDFAFFHLTNNWERGYGKVRLDGEAKKDALELFAERNPFAAVNETYKGIPSRVPFAAFLDGEMTFFNAQKVMDKDQNDYWILLYWKYGSFPFWYQQDWDLALAQLAFLIFTGTMIFVTVDYFLHRHRFLTEEYRQVLADSMATDLKAPLMAVSGYAENLKANIHEEKRSYYAGEIISSVSAMDELIKQNLELLNFEQLQKPLHKTQVNLRLLCEKVLKKYEREIAQKHLEIFLEGEMVVKADEVLMERVMDSLLSNAVKYARENSRVELYFSRYVFQIQNQTDMVYRGRMTNLWEPLVRGRDTGAVRGNGLGLSIAANILDRHKWKYKLAWLKQDKTFICRIKIPVGLMF